MTEPPSDKCPECGEEEQYGPHQGEYNQVHYICDECGYSYSTEKGHNPE